MPGGAAGIRLPRRRLPHPARHPLAHQADADDAAELSGAFTKPEAANETLAGLLAAEGVHVEPDVAVMAVGAGPATSSCPYDEREAVPYDLLVTIPPHEGSDLIDDAGLGDGLGFGLTDKQTLKSRKAERVFLLGDNTNVPTSKAGSVAHFQAEVVVHNLLREIAGKDAQPLADGHANCFIETGRGKAILVDFNYDIQPVPGKFPLPVVGPMTLLAETRLNHLGKLAFKPIYWNVLLPGRPIPLVGSRMSTMGKRMGAGCARAALKADAGARASRAPAGACTRQDDVDKRLCFAVRSPNFRCVSAAANWHRSFRSHEGATASWLKRHGQAKAKA